MDSTELHAFKQNLQAAIDDAVTRKDRRWLEAISGTVHDLELELLEAYWELDQNGKANRSPVMSRYGRSIFGECKRIMLGCSIYFMRCGVSLAREAASIRSRLKAGRIAMKMENSEGVTFPLSPQAKPK